MRHSAPCWCMRAAPQLVVRACKGSSTNYHRKTDPKPRVWASTDCRLLQGSGVPRIVPRVAVEVGQGDIGRLLSPAGAAAAAGAIAAELEAASADGLVLEVVLFV